MTQPAAAVAEPTPHSEPREDKMPTSILFIVANEFAERFCYYGINAILIIYMVQTLHLGDAQATTYSSLFKGGAYFSPLVGAIVSDVFLGQVQDDHPVLDLLRGRLRDRVARALARGPRRGAVPRGLGTGGIKPCVSTNVGDQFTSKNQHLIERAFSATSTSPSTPARPSPSSSAPSCSRSTDPCRRSACRR